MTRTPAAVPPFPERMEGEPSVNQASTAGHSVAIALSLRSVRPVGRIAWRAGVLRLYCDGSGVGFVWRWWHPLTWLLVPIVLLASVLLEGIPKTLAYPHDLGFGVSRWFKEHPERLVWIPWRMTRLLITREPQEGDAA